MVAAARAGADRVSRLTGGDNTRMSPDSVIRYNELEPMPWRNGLGETRTIRPMPPEGGWALSIATIARPAAYSRIPRTQRVQLAIEAVRLEIDGAQLVLGAGEQAVFTGEQHVTGASIGGTSRVLNLMYGEGTPPLAMAVVRDTNELQLDALAVVVLEGELDFACGRLEALDTLLRVPGGQRLETSGGGVFALITPTLATG